LPLRRRKKVAVAGWNSAMQPAVLTAAGALRQAGADALTAAAMAEAAHRTPNR
jgi:hypothetical protein